MAATPYGPYSISGDFPDGKVNFTQLRQEIEAQITSPPYLYHEANGDELTLYFDGALSSAQEDLLDSIIAAHHPADTTQSAQTVASLAESVTSSTSWQVKLALTLPPMKNGDYQFIWYCEIAKNTAAGVAAQVTYNGNEQAYSSWGETQYHAFSGTVVATMKEGNTPTLALNVKALGTGEVKIRRARFAVVFLDRET